MQEEEKPALRSYEQKLSSPAIEITEQACEEAQQLALRRKLKNLSLAQKNDLKYWEFD